MDLKNESLLEADHAELDGLLAEVFRALDEADCRSVFRTLDYFWARLAMHIRAEHLQLFPAVVHVAENSATRNALDEVPDLVRRLHEDHDFFMHELATAINAVRLVSDSANETQTLKVVRNILVQVRERLAAHDQIEEESIYPIAVARFMSADAIEELSQSIEKELTNLPPRFKPDAGS